MKIWQIENSETSEILEISEILFRVFLFPSFRFCPTAKIENSDSKIFKKKIPNFLRDSKFSEFSTWLTRSGKYYYWYSILVVQAALNLFIDTRKGKYQQGRGNTLW